MFMSILPAGFGRFNFNPRMCDLLWQPVYHHMEVDDLFVQWNSDPLELLNLTGLGIP
ncbi:MAG: hypothetical protein ACYC3X_28925 [Pirellulaceae bacterium]